MHIFTIDLASKIAKIENIISKADIRRFYKI